MGATEWVVEQLKCELTRKIGYGFLFCTAKWIIILLIHTLPRSVKTSFAKNLKLTWIKKVMAFLPYWKRLWKSSKTRDVFCAAKWIIILLIRTLPRSVKTSFAKNLKLPWIIKVMAFLPYWKRLWKSYKTRDVFDN